jgi:hypothetical protein
MGEADRGREAGPGSKPPCFSDDMARKAVDIENRRRKCRRHSKQIVVYQSIALISRHALLEQNVVRLQDYTVEILRVESFTASSKRYSSDST